MKSFQRLYSSLFDTFFHSNVFILKIIAHVKLDMGNVFLSEITTNAYLLHLLFFIVCSGDHRPVGAEPGVYLYCPPQRWLNNIQVSHNSVVIADPK